MRKALLILTGIAVLGASAAAAENPANWPQWRGPLFTGEAPNAQPPTAWGEDKNIKWKVAVPGFGNSTPVIWGNRIYLVTAITEAPASGSPQAAAAPPPRPPEAARPPASAGTPGEPGARANRGAGAGEDLAAEDPGVSAGKLRKGRHSSS